jgi:hypothetical protein
MDKQRERATVEAFLLSQGYPISLLEEWDRERPDALVRLDGMIVGIEVTKVVEAAPRQATPPQMWITEANRIVRAAQTTFERSHSAALVVRFALRPDWRPNKRGLAELAQELATIIEKVTPRKILAGGLLRVPLQSRNPHPAVSWVYVGSTKQSLGSHWAPSFAHSRQYATPEDIQEAVQRKEPEIKVYRQAAPQVWLLIDCDLSGQGIALVVPDLSKEFSVTSGFDRVFCCGFGMWQWVEILRSGIRVEAGES